MKKSEIADVAKSYANQIATSKEPENKLADIALEVKKKFAPEDAESILQKLKSRLKKIKTRGSNQEFLKLVAIIDDLLKAKLATENDEKLENFDDLINQKLADGNDENTTSLDDLINQKLAFNKEITDKTKTESDGIK